MTRAGEGLPDVTLPQFPLRAAHSQQPVDRGILAPDQPVFTGPGSPGVPSRGPPGPPRLAPDPATTHLSGGRTPTHRRLRLRTAALPGSASGRDACAERAGSRGVFFCASALMIEAGVGRSDVT